MRKNVISGIVILALSGAVVAQEVRTVRLPARQSQIDALDLYRAQNTELRQRRAQLEADEKNFETRYRATIAEIRSDCPGLGDNEMPNRTADKDGKPFWVYEAR